MCVGRVAMLVQHGRNALEVPFSLSEDVDSCRCCRLRVSPEMPVPTPPSAFEIPFRVEGKKDVDGWVGVSRKGIATLPWASECVCKTINLYSRLTFTVRNCPSALKQHVKNN